jgi:hypothetical protein
MESNCEKSAKGKFSDVVDEQQDFAKIIFFANKSEQVSLCFEQMSEKDFAQLQQKLEAENSDFATETEINCI